MHAFTIPPLWYVALLFFAAVAVGAFLQAWRKRAAGARAAWWWGLGLALTVAALGLAAVIRLFGGLPLNYSVLYSLSCLVALGHVTAFRHNIAETRAQLLAWCAIGMIPFVNVAVVAGAWYMARCNDAVSDWLKQPLKKSKGNSCLGPAPAGSAMPGSDHDGGEKVSQ